MNSNEITFKELVLIGGGHAHVHILKMIGMKPIKGVRITLISKDYDTPYSGMLPGFVSGQYSREECHLDLRQISSFSSIRFIQSEDYVSKIRLLIEHVLLMLIHNHLHLHQQQLNITMDHY